jgi:hypothetical protein
MRVFLIATALAATSFLAHWVWWRIRIPKRQTAALLATFSLVLVVGLTAVVGPTGIAPRSWRLDNAWEVSHVAAFHVAAMLAYVVAYSAIEERSPSMTILSRVATSGPAGAVRDELEMLLKTVSPVEIRIAAMIRDGMIDDDNDHLVLTAKGRAWATLFSWWRTFLGCTKGG